MFELIFVRSGKLWEFYLFSLELANSSDFNNEFAKSLQSGIQTADEFYLLYRANIDYHWRNINKDQKNQEGKLQASQITEF